MPNVRSGALVVASSTTDTTTTDNVDGSTSTTEQQSYFTMTTSISGTSNDNGIYVDEIDGSIADPCAATAATTSTEETVTLLLWKCKLCTFG